MKQQIIEKLKTQPKTRKYLEFYYDTCDFTVYYNLVTKKGRISTSPKKSLKPKMKIIFIDLEKIEGGLDYIESAPSVKQSKKQIKHEIDTNTSVFPKFLGQIERTGKLQHIEPSYEYINEPGNIPAYNYGVEQQDSSRKWLVRDYESIQNDLKTHPWPIHELITGTCKYFCDIDDVKEDFYDYIDRVRKHFAKLFPKFYQHEPAIANFIEKKCTFAYNTFIAVSEANYNSAHIVFEIIIKETGTKLYAPNAYSQREFWKEMAGIFDKIDLVVYRKNAQLRVINSPKDGYCLRPLTHDFNLFYNDLYGRSQWSGEGPENITTTIDTNLFRKDNINDYCVGINLDNYTGIQNNNYEMKIEQNTNYKKFYSHYDVMRVTKAIENSYFDYESLTPFSIWREAVCRIYHFFHFISHEARQRMVLDFCRARGWNSHKADNENIILCHDFSSLKLEIGYGVDGMFEFFKPKYNIQKVEMKEVSYNINKRIFCLKSGTNTKKTLNFVKSFADKSVLFITYRCSLALEIIDTAEYAKLQFAHYKDEIIDCPQHLVVQLESLHKFEHILDNYEYVFLDECEALIGQFCFSFEQGCPRNFAILQEMIDEVMNNKKIVCVSANLGDETRNFIENYGHDYEWVENTVIDKKGWSYVDYKKPAHLINEIINMAKAGKKLIIAINSREKSVQIADKLDPDFNENYKKDLIKKMGGQLEEGYGEQIKVADKLKKYGKVLLMNSYTPFVPPSEWVNYDFVIHSSVIEAGVNFIVEDYFDHICGYFINTTNTYESCYQMLFRCRNPKSKQIHLYSARGEQLKERDYLDEQAMSIRNEFLKQHKENKPYKPFFDKRAHPIRKSIIYHQLKKNHSKYNFGNLLKKELHKSGFVRIEPTIVNDHIELSKTAHNIFVKTNVKYNNAGECINVISKLKRLNLCADDIDLFDGCKNNVKTIDALVNYYSIKTGKDLNPEQYVVNELLNMGSFNDLKLNEFLAKNWHMLGLNTSAKAFMDKKMHNKVKTLNGLFANCFMKIAKEHRYSDYCLQPLDEALLQKIERKEIYDIPN